MESRGEKTFKAIWDYCQWIVVIAGAISVLYGAVSWIDNRIEEKMSDEHYIKKVAKYVRPALIFNTEGQILADLGAAYHAKVLVDKKDTRIDVTIRPTRYLQVSPIIESLDETYFITYERGKDFDWICHLGFPGMRWTDPPPKDYVPQPPRFRLELVITD